MDDWRAGKGKDNSETQPQTGSRVDPPKTPRKRTAAEYYNDRNSKNWRPNELENSPPSPSIKKEPTDKESAKIKKEQNDSDFSWLYGGTEFARAAYQVLFDADKSGKQDTSREIIELE